MSELNDTDFTWIRLRYGSDIFHLIHYLATQGGHRWAWVVERLPAERQPRRGWMPEPHDILRLLALILERDKTERNHDAGDGDRIQFWLYDWMAYCKAESMVMEDRHVAWNDDRYLVRTLIRAFKDVVAEESTAEEARRALRLN